MRFLYRVIRNILAVFGLIWLIVTVTPLTAWWAGLLMGPWNSPAGGVLIVLGADGPTDGIIGLTSYWRSAYAAWAWRDNKFPKILISGDSDTAGSMKAFLICQGVPAEKIVLESRSRSTRENAIHTAEIVSQMPVRKVLLTSDFHVYRSVRAFRKAGVEVTSVPFPYAIKRANVWLDRWPVFLELCVESVKILYYRARGWI